MTTAPEHTNNRGICGPQKSGEKVSVFWQKRGIFEQKVGVPRLVKL
jgi:hypothetical protein